LSAEPLPFDLLLSESRRAPLPPGVRRIGRLCLRCGGQMLLDREAFTAHDYLWCVQCGNRVEL